MQEITTPDDKGFITCTCCGQTNNFGRVDKIYIETKVQVLGECYVCLNKKADEMETAEVKAMLSLNENQNANPSGPPADAGK